MFQNVPTIYSSNKMYLNYYGYAFIIWNKAMCEDSFHSQDSSFRSTLITV